MKEILYRDNKLWEGSRMFLPEHKEALLAYYQQEKKISTPTLDDQQKEHIARMLQKALFQKQPVTITYVAPYEYKVISGHICKLDVSNRRMYLSDESGTDKEISFDQLIHIE